MHHRIDVRRHPGAGGGHRDGVGDAGRGGVQAEEGRSRHQTAADRRQAER